MDVEEMDRDQHFEALIEEAKGALEVVKGEMGVGMGGCGEKERGEGDVVMEQVVEDKRRRFGRFMGMRECESPGAEDEGVMRVAMEAWVGGEIARREWVEREREALRAKGAWEERDG